MRECYLSTLFIFIEKYFVNLVVKYLFPLSGMVSRDFRGIPSIQEVECWGGYLEADAKVFSLTLFKISDNRILSNVNHLTNQCVTYGDFSSCTIDSGNTRNSRIRILVTDMAEEEARKYGCNVTSFKLVGEIPRAVTWSITVTRPSKLFNHSRVSCERYRKIK